MSKVSNINKRLIAGGCVLTLLTTGLVGCDAISVNNIRSVSNEQGEITFNLDYNTLKSCSFYRVYNNKINKEYYTIGLIDKYNGSYFIKVYDIFTKEEIKFSECSFRAITAVSHYLDDIDMVKEKYTEEELREILNTFIENYLKENNKQKVKGK